MITHQLKPALAAIAIGLVQSATVAEPPSPHLNVVFIIADDMNAYGFYHELAGVKMPHMDAFRKTAVTLDRAYCAAPSCVPSRASFFSGQYPFTTGSYLNGSDPWQKTAMANIAIDITCLVMSYMRLILRRLRQTLPPSFL